MLIALILFCGVAHGALIPNNYFKTKDGIILPDFRKMCLDQNCTMEALSNSLKEIFSINKKSQPLASNPRNADRPITVFNTHVTINNPKIFMKGTNTFQISPNGIGTESGETNMIKRFVNGVSPVAQNSSTIKTQDTQKRPTIIAPSQTVEPKLTENDYNNTAPILPPLTSGPNFLDDFPEDFGQPQPEPEDEEYIPPKNSLAEHEHDDLEEENDYGFYSLPNRGKLCREENPDYDNCVREASSQIIPALFNQENILKTPQLEPFECDDVFIQLGKQVQVHFGNRADFGGLEIHGINDAILRNFSIYIYNTKYVTAQAQLFIPKLTVNGEARVTISASDPKAADSRLLGNFKSIAENVVFELIWDALVTSSDGHKYLDVISVRIKYENLGVMNIILDGQLLTYKAFILENQEQIVQRIFKAVDKNLNQIILDTTDLFFVRVPIDMLSVQPDPDLKATTEIQATVQSPEITTQVPIVNVKSETRQDLSKDDDSMSQDFVLPAFVKPCGANEPNKDQCLREILYRLIPFLFNESKPFLATEINPITIEHFKMDHDPGYYQTHHITFNNTKIYGMSDAEFKEFGIRMYSDAVIVELNLFFPKITMSGLYKAELSNRAISKTLVYPAVGPFNAEMTNVLATYKMNGNFVQRHGHKYVRINRVEIDQTVDGHKFELRNEDQKFTKQQVGSAIEFINSHWGNIYKKFVKESKYIWAPSIIGVINNFLGRIPFDLLSYK